MYTHVYIMSYFIIMSYYFIIGMSIGYSMVVLLLWLSFIVVVPVTVSILVIVVIIVIILLVMRIVLRTVKTRKCKFDILIMTASCNVKYIGTKNGMLQQDDQDSNESNSEL